jgi:glycosyltransferase involved in cell wall biosynthesis
LNVIVVTDYALVNGGAGKVALESAVALCGHVDKVHVFAGIGDVSSILTGIPNLEVTTLRQQKVTEQGVGQAFIAGLWNKPAQSAFRELLRKYDPKDTVIHVHSWRDGLTLSFMPEIEALGFKFVFTGHDYGLACPMAGFYNHKQGKICEHIGLSRQCLTTSCTGRSFIKKQWFVARHALQPLRAHMPSGLRHLITVGPLSERILKPYLRKDVRIHHVPNPIQIDKQPRTAVEHNRGYAFVGRYSPEKAPLLAAKATHNLGLPVTFVGTGQLVDEIRFLNPDAQMHGWREPHEVREILRTVRGLIFPSVWYEVQGMVVDEAIAMGVPVACSDACAGADTIRRLGGGALFRSGDVNALERRLIEFENDSVIKTYSEEGYSRYWQEPHTMELHIRRLLEVYSEVLAS